MKNTLMIPLVFFLNLILWMLVISFFSVFATFNGMTALISGAASVFFYECLYQAFYYFPVCLALALLAVFFFLVRHKAIIWLTSLSMLGLTILCLFLLMPLSYRYLRTNSWDFLTNRSELTASANNVFSPGIIRQDTNASRMIWFSVTEGGRKVSPLVIGNTNQAHAVFSVYPEADYNVSSGSLSSGSRTLVNRADGPDPLFFAVFEPPPVLALISQTAITVMDAFLDTAQKGFVSYAFFSLSFFISVGLLCLLCFATGWRLLNILFTLTGLLYLFVVYRHFSSGPIFDFATRIVPASVNSSFIPSVLYLLHSVLFALIGGFIALRRMIRFATRRKRI